MWTSPVRKARVPVGMANRSSSPNIAAASAPRMPRPTSHRDPVAATAGCAPRREATSKTRLATQAPMGTVTRTGWSGCPYGPASRLTGRLAVCIPVATLPPPLPPHYDSEC
jgi:hypothetical protein